LLSQGCQPLFADPTLVTRIAEMANFFTNMLVGKNRKMLKVKGCCFAFEMFIYF